MQWRMMAAGVALTVVSAGGLTVEHVQLATEQDSVVAAEQDHRRGHLAPHDGTEMLREAHERVARGDTRNFCSLFNQRGAARFAAAWRAPSCQAAAESLAAQVQDATRYPSFSSSSATALPLPEGGVVVDGCSVTWGSAVQPQPAAGPGFGRLELTRISPGGGLEINDYDPCPGSANTTPPSATSSTTTTTMSPWMRRRAPAYPPAYGQILGRAIANGDSSICQLFVGGSAQQFAAAHGTATCEEAVVALQNQVSNPTWYATQPGGITTTSTAEGYTVVHACQLDWSSVSRYDTPAGPPMGHLTTSARGGGYVIVGYEPC